jgi:aminoglycoside 6'-N-acetyltransferase
MELRGERVVLRPVEPAHAARLREIRAEPDVACWWGPPEEGFPEDDDPDVVRFAVLEERAVIGMVQYGEETEAMYQHAWLDIYLDPAVRGRGLGVDAVQALVRHLIEERGHHRVVIDPAADNAAAIRAYAKAGFTRVGTMRLAERSPVDGRWRDSLLMEHVVEPRG